MVLASNRLYRPSAARQSGSALLLVLVVSSVLLLAGLALSFTVSIEQRVSGFDQCPIFNQNTVDPTALYGIEEYRAFWYESAAQWHEILERTNRHIGHNDALRIDAKGATTGNRVEDPPGKQQNGHNAGPNEQFAVHWRLALNLSIHSRARHTHALRLLTICDIPDFAHFVSLPCSPE